MTDEQAKSLGLRALALGMPWVEGLMDGGASRDYNGDTKRVGCLYVEGISDEYNHIIAEFHDEPGKLSWPDFRDPLTEAWLVAWGLRQWDEYAYRGSSKYIYYQYIDEQNAQESPVPGWYIGLIADGMEIDLVLAAPTRAEAWIVALEKLKEEG